MKGKPRSRRPGRPGPRRPPRPQPELHPRPGAADVRREVSASELDSDFAVMMDDLRREDVEPADDVAARLREYGLRVVERSSLLNLVSPADRGTIFTRHVGECLSSPLLAKARSADRLVDIGTGAGLPGIPLALACPGLAVALVEPRLRKAQFLESTVHALGLSDRVLVHQGTAESFVRADPLRFDLATARAVGRIPLVWEWSRKLLVPGGCLAVFKGEREVEEEVARIENPPATIDVSPAPGRPRLLVFLYV